MEYLDTQQQVLQYILYDPEVLAVLYYGGVRGGKSLTVCKAALQVLEHFPGARALLARDTRVNLEATTLQTLWGTDRWGHPILPYGIYDERDHNQTKGFINWPNGGYLSMMGLDTKQNIGRVKSSEWSFVGLEEANTIAWLIVKFMIETRMTHAIGPRKILLTTNTDEGEGSGELHKFFFETHTCDPKKHCENCPRGRCQFRRVLAQTLANKANLPASFIERASHLAATDPRYHDIYMQGKFALVSGAIFPEYDERVHILDFPAGYQWIDNGEWITRRAYDHGWGASPSCLLESKIHLPTGTVVFWDEYYTDPTMRRSVRLMAQDFGHMDPPVNYVHHADPSIQNKNQDDGDDITSVKAKFEQEGVHMELADNDVSGGIETMKSMLERDPLHRCPVPGVAIEGLPNQPHIYIARVGGYLRCPNLNRQFPKYKNKQNVKGEENPSKWDPVKLDDHALDPARYTINGAPLPQNLRKQEEKPHTSGWAVKLQLRKESAQTPDGFRDDTGGFRTVSSL